MGEKSDGICWCSCWCQTVEHRANSGPGCFGHTNQRAKGPLLCIPLWKGYTQWRVDVVSTRNYTGSKSTKKKLERNRPIGSKQTRMNTSMTLALIISNVSLALGCFTIAWSWETLLIDFLLFLASFRHVLRQLCFDTTHGRRSEAAVTLNQQHSP
jgi:hypothetical protein